MADQPRMQPREKPIKIKPPLASASKNDVAALKAELEIELKSIKRCSYKAYDCNQLTIEGYNFCLKHILNDKLAPFKQCSFIYSANGKRCQLPAPKIDKKDFGFCNDHAIKTALTKNRQNSRYAPPPTAEALLFSLGHYVKRPKTQKPQEEVEKSGQDEGGDHKATRSVDPYLDIDANSLYNSTCNNLLDFCSESDSDVEAATFGSVWPDPQNDSSDNESVDSDQDDVLKHANVYTAEEISLISRDKLIKLQSLYIEQYRYLQHVLKEKKKTYYHSLKREKETCCNIYSQIRENPKEQRLYKKLKALNKYNRHYGVEAILNKRMHDSRAKITDGVFSKPPTYTKCLYTEGGVKCSDRALPLAKHCRKHILEDHAQVLFRACNKKKVDVECSTPVEVIFEDSSCRLHCDIPPVKSYAFQRKNSESDYEDSFEITENMLMETDNVKTELIDDFKADPEEMKTLPSVLFEESSMDVSVKNEDAIFDDKKEEPVDVESIDGALEIDLSNTGSQNSLDFAQDKEDNVTHLPPL